MLLPNPMFAVPRVVPRAFALGAPDPPIRPCHHATYLLTCGVLGRPYGRLGQKSLETLNDLASWAAVASPYLRIRESSLLKRWRHALEATLLHEKADLLMQCLGSQAADWTNGVAATWMAT